MQSRTLLGTLALLMVAFAGCADQAAALEEDTASFDDFELEATETTGIIRGVVVDSSIVPLAGAEVTISGTDNTVTTNEDGAFGFSDLEAGFYTLSVDALGYIGTQTQAEVVAGVESPPAVRVMLEANPSELPYVQPLTFNGYIECSISSPAYRVAVCSVPNIVAPGTIQEDFMMVHEGQDPEATWVQAEMIWKSTQALGSSMMFTMEAGCSSDGCDMPDAENSRGAGTSPIVMIADTEDLQADWQLYTGTIQHRVFNMEMDGTAPPVPVCGVPNPVHGGTMCVKGWGATLQQKFDIFTHVFSNGVPQDGWTFGADGEPTIQPVPGS